MFIQTKIVKLAIGIPGKLANKFLILLGILWRKVTSEGYKTQIRAIAANKGDFFFHLNKSFGRKYHQTFALSHVSKRYQQVIKKVVLINEQTVID